MLKFATILGVVKEKCRRWFPERQLYFRANGVVRFLSLSPRVQMLGTLATCFLLVWFVIASVNFFTRDAAIAAREQQIDELARSYEALDAELRSIQIDMLARTERLKERQKYLRELLGGDTELLPTGNGPAPAGKSKPEAALPATPVASVDPRPGSFFKRILGGQVQSAAEDPDVQSLRRDLARLEQSQEELAAQLARAISAQSRRLLTILQSTGISKEGVIRMAFGPDVPAAQGGPFIAAELDDAELAGDAALAEGDPFELLIQYRSELSALQAVLKNAPFVVPLDDFYISSSYGKRRDPINGRRAVHRGADLAAWRNSPVKAGADGVVRHAGWKGAYGILVEVDHGNGFVTRYGHLRQAKVTAGQAVSASDVIGLVGSTGRSTGPHLHYEIWFDGKPLNPVNFFKAAEDVLTLSRQPDRVG